MFLIPMVAVAFFSTAIATIFYDLNTAYIDIMLLILLTTTLVTLSVYRRGSDIRSVFERTRFKSSRVFVRWFKFKLKSVPLMYGIEPCAMLPMIFLFNGMMFEFVLSLMLIMLMAFAAKSVLDSR